MTTKKFAYANSQPGEQLYWSNVDGWVDLMSATLFDMDQLDQLNAPVGATAIVGVSESDRREVFAPLRLLEVARVDRSRWSHKRRHQERVAWLSACESRIDECIALYAKRCLPFGSGFDLPETLHPWEILFTKMREAGLYLTPRLTCGVYQGLFHAVMNVACQAKAERRKRLEVLIRQADDPHA